MDEEPSIHWKVRGGFILSTKSREQLPGWHSSSLQCRGSSIVVIRTAEEINYLRPLFILRYPWPPARTSDFELQRWGYVHAYYVALVVSTLCNPIDCSPPGSSIHGILQARILEWIAIPFSKRSHLPRDWTCISCVLCIASRLFTSHQGSSKGHVLFCKSSNIIKCM